MTGDPAFPIGWRNQRLRYVATFPSKSEVSGLPDSTPVSFVPMEAVGEYGGITLNQSKILGEVKDGYSYFRDGDVLVAKITPCFENGKGALADRLESGIGFGTTELHVLRARHGVCPRYLFYITCSRGFRGLGEGAMYGAGGQKRVPEDFIKNLVYPIPGLQEQIAIADFLDRETVRVDELATKKERLVSLLDESVASYVSARTADPLVQRASKSTQRLRTITSLLQTGPFGSQLHAEDYVDNGIPVINPSNISNRTIVPDYGTCVPSATATRLARHQLQPLDIVMARRGEMGRSGLVEPSQKGWLCGTGSLIVRLRLDLVNPRYLIEYLTTSYIAEFLLQHSVGSTIDNLNTSIIGKIPVCLPSTETQTRVVCEILERRSEAGALRDATLRGIARLREYRTALISTAVIGQIDVRTYRKEPEAVMEAET